MPTIEEITAWSEADLSDEIEALIPEGWALRIEANIEGYWEVSIDRLSEGSDPIIEFLESHIDKRLALLNIYGALWARKSRVSVDPNWTNRKELTKQAVSINSSSVRDPEDLDPSEVESVYLSLRGKK